MCAYWIFVFNVYRHMDRRTDGHRNKCDQKLFWFFGFIAKGKLLLRPYNEFHGFFSGYKEKHILPICLERCEVPKYLRLVSKVDFYSTRSGGLQWEQLYRSLSSSPHVPEQDKQKDTFPDIVKSSQI